MTVTPEQAYDALEGVSKFVNRLDEIVATEHKGFQLISAQGAVEFQIAREYIMMSHPDKLKTWP
jgi:hypothetical protein